TRSALPAGGPGITLGTPRCLPRRRGSMKLRRKVVYPILPLALVVLFAAPTPAHALGDWIGVEGAFWHNSQSGSASIDGDVFGGTSVDFQDTLDLDRTDNSKMGRVWLHWGKSRLFLDRVEANGIEFNAGVTRVNVLDGRVQAEMYVAHVLGFFAGYRTFHMAADNKDFGSVSNTFKGPYAGLGLRF